MAEPLPQRVLAAVRRAFDGTVDARRYRLIQGAMGWMLLAYTAFWARNYREWITPEGFHPSVTATATQSPAMPLVSPAVAVVLGVVFFGALAAFLFGYKRRVTGAVVLLGCIYTLLVDPIASFTINRLNVICFGIFVLAPEPVANDDDNGPKEVMLAWPATMLAILVLVHYFAAGLCKVFHGSWADYNDVLWVQIQGVYRTEIAAWMVRTVPQGGFLVLQHLALAFELLAPVLLGIRKLRPIGIVIGFGMHIMISLTMQHLVFFSTQMMAFYVLFFPDAWLDRFDALLEDKPDRPRKAKTKAVSQRETASESQD